MYYIKSQISGETLHQTESAQEAKELAHKEGYIQQGLSGTEYPRRYVEDESGKVVYAHYRNRPEKTIDLL